MLQVQQNKTIKVDCPVLQNKKKNCHHKRAIKGTWSDESNSNSSDNDKHVANMCFMAIKHNNDVISLDDESDLSYDELHDAFESLCNEFKTLGYTYSSLKKSHRCLLVEKDALERKSCIVIDNDNVS